MLYSNYSKTVKSIYNTKEEMVILSHSSIGETESWHKPFDVVSTQAQNKVLQIEYSSNDLDQIKTKFDAFILEGPVYPRLQESLDTA